MIHFVFLIKIGSRSLKGRKSQEPLAAILLPSEVFYEKKKEKTGPKIRRSVVYGERKAVNKKGPRNTWKNSDSSQQQKKPAKKGHSTGPRMKKREKTNMYRPRQILLFQEDFQGSAFTSGKNGGFELQTFLQLARRVSGESNEDVI